jgi:uncharacterized membrane protein
LLLLFGKTPHRLDITSFAVRLVPRTVCPLDRTSELSEQASNPPSKQASNRASKQASEQASKQSSQQAIQQTKASDDDTQGQRTRQGYLLFVVCCLLFVVRRASESESRE